jgi:hypothetical protein
MLLWPESKKRSFPIGLGAVPVNRQATMHARRRRRRIFMVRKQDEGREREAKQKSNGTNKIECEWLDYSEATSDPEVV